MARLSRPARALLRLRSMRLRALLVVAVVVVAPLAVVWLSDVSDQGTRTLLQARLESLAREAASLDPADASDLEALALSGGVRLRRVEPSPDLDGAVSLDLDHGTPQALVGRTSRLFFGPDGLPDLTDWDATQPKLAQRPEVIEARQQGQGSRCAPSQDDLLLVCATAVRLESGAVLHLQTGSPRAIRGLRDARFQLLKLTLVVGIMGLLLGLWLGWRMVRPLELLRNQVRDRARTGSTAPVELARNDEFGELAQAFNTLLAELSRRAQANESFTTDLVHELKNPIAAVRAASEALESGKPLSPERAARLARILRGSSERLDAVATRFLELARAEAGLAELSREAVKLDQLVEALVAALPDGHGIELHTEPVQVPAAPERLETLVRNLLDNALHHAALEGSGRVQVQLRRRGSTAELRVEDSGPGVPPEDRERVFERFFSRREGGTGVGLALARAIAQAHQGSLHVEDSELGGAAFVLQLPNSEVT